MQLKRSDDHSKATVSTTCGEATKKKLCAIDGHTMVIQRSFKGRNSATYKPSTVISIINSR